MHILIVDDDDTLRNLLAKELRYSGHTVTCAATAMAGLSAAAEAEPDVVVLDVALPDLPGVEVLRRLRVERPTTEVVMLTAHGTVDTALEAMKLGAYDYLQKPCHLEELERTLQGALDRRRLNEDNARLKDGLRPRSAEASYVGCGPAFSKLQQAIGKLAATDATVLLQGETGTGKELVARSLHHRSRRREQPFVVVDCASLHENLLQSELFGHERGAFTGAARRTYGLFEVADGGTVFLDEVGEVSPPTQASLLRVLETSTFRRVGGTKEVRVDVRLIAATNRDLVRMVRANQFREDLYFRLKAMHIELAPLRERPEEIPCLVEHFVERHNRQTGAERRISPEAMEVLVSYPWPGNVRQLRHTVEQSLVLCGNPIVRASNLPRELRRRLDRVQSDPDLGAVLPLAELERRHIFHVLRLTEGHRARSAAALGISERSLYRKLREHRFDEGAAERGAAEQGDPEQGDPEPGDPDQGWGDVEET